MTRSRLFFGVAFIAIGALLLADYAGVVDAGPVASSWWPLLIAVAGVARIVGTPRSAAIGLVFLLVAGVLLLWTHGFVDSLALLWPVFLIGIGLVLLTRRSSWDSGAAVTSDGDINVVLSDRRAKAAPGPLAVRSVTTVLGDIDLDLTPATLTQDGELKLVGVLADIDVTVPNDWHVVVHGSDVLGSVTSPQTSPPPGAPTLRIETVAVLADISIHAGAREPQATTAS